MPRHRSRTPRRDRNPTGKDESRKSSCIIIPRLPDRGTSQEDIEELVVDVAIKEGISVPTSVSRPPGKSVAFVQFAHVEAGRDFMTATKGVLYIKGKSYTIEYSKKPEDWICARCSYSNYGDRKQCKRCSSSHATPACVSSSTSCVSTRSSSLVIRRLPVSMDRGAVVSLLSPECRASLVDVRLVPHKNVAFMDFLSIESAARAFECLHALRDHCVIEFVLPRAADKVNDILLICPVLCPCGDRYYTDPEQVWMFDRDTLYWYHTSNKCYYVLMQEKEGKYFLNQVDSSGKLIQQDAKSNDDVRLPLPVVTVTSSFPVVAMPFLVEPEPIIPPEHTSLIHSSQEKPLPIPEVTDENMGPVVSQQSRRPPLIVCRLCLRKFDSQDLLVKHEFLSERHKNNLEKRDS